MNENETHIPQECAAIRTLFSPFLDAELDGEPRERVEQHLQGCAACLRVLHGYKQVSDGYAALPRPQAPADFEDRVIRRIAPRPGVGQRLRPYWRSGVALAAVLLCTFSLALYWTQYPWGGAPETALDFHARETAPVQEEAASETAVMADEPAPEPMMAPRVLGDRMETSLDAAEEVPEAAEGLGMGARAGSEADALRRGDDNRAPEAAPAPQTMAAPQADMLSAPAPPPPAPPQSKEADNTARVDATGQHRVLGARSFVLRDGQWIESRVSTRPPEAPTAYTDLSHDSQALEALLQAAPELRPLLDWDAPVYLHHHNTWYLLPPKPSTP